MVTTEDILKHAGVKGMKWGVRKVETSKTGKSSNPGIVKKAVNRVKSEVRSSKREMSWGKMDIGKMTTKDIAKLSQRIQTENDFKRLSKKTNVGSSKDRKAYRDRHKLSDSKLSKKVERLRVKEAFDRNYKEATKTQREVGKKIVNRAAKVAISSLV